MFLFLKWFCAFLCVCFCVFHSFPRVSGLPMALMSMQPQQLLLLLLLLLVHSTLGCCSWEFLVNDSAFFLTSRGCVELDGGEQDVRHWKFCDVVRGAFLFVITPGSYFPLQFRVLFFFFFHSFFVSCLLLPAFFALVANVLSSFLPMQFRLLSFFLYIVFVVVRAFCSCC